MAHAGPTGAMGRLSSLASCSWPQLCNPQQTLRCCRDAVGPGATHGEREPREQHWGPAPSVREGGWEPWPWSWCLTGSVGERVKELQRAGGGLARLGERKEAEEERRASCPEGLLGAPFPREEACGA